jgi:hypothetical protein
MKKSNIHLEQKSKDYNRLVSRSKTYNKVLTHRGRCSKWKTHEYCLKCNGGGLNKFGEHLLMEIIENEN